jgi:hypothetical protein
LQTLGLRPGEPPDGELAGGRATKVARVLEVLGVTPVSSEPREDALDHPTARQDDEALHVVAPLDDLHAQDRHLGNGSINLPAL